MDAVMELQVVVLKKNLQASIFFGRIKKSLSAIFLAGVALQSVDGGKYGVHIVMDQCKGAKQVVMSRACLCKPALSEGEVAVGIQADNDAKGIGRYRSSISILRAYVVDSLRYRGHVEAVVAQNIERPVTSVVVAGQSFG
jgi:hypothetical protein